VRAEPRRIWPRVCHGRRSANQPRPSRSLRETRLTRRASLARRSSQLLVGVIGSLSPGRASSWRGRWLNSATWSRSARLLGSAVGFLERAGARREWMDESCEAAVRQTLHDHFDERAARALLDAGRTASLETVARDALCAPAVIARTAE
jgi:hypothetical protein